MILSQRIEALLEYSNMNIPKFAEFVGFKTPQTVRELIKGNTKSLSEAAQYKITLAFPMVNPEWLLTGEGNMLLPDKGESNEVSGYKERVIPFYDAETTGGYNGRVSASDVGSLKGYIQPGGWFDGRETAAIRHVGDSMVEYPDGCVLAVREVLDKHLLVPGRNYVIETREYRVTKRVQRGSSPNSIMLYSSNSEKYDDGRLVHEPFEVALEDVLHIFSVLGYIVNQSGEFRLIKP